MSKSLAEVRAAHPDVRWIPAHKLHLTLVFLGATDPSRVAQLNNAIQSVAARHERFRVGTGEAGGRVNAQRGGVAWLRIAEGGHRVANLALDLDEAMDSNTYDAHNSPRPHLTVARRATPEALAALRAQWGSLESSWWVDRIVLFRSSTDPAGSRYEELTSVALRA